MSLPAAYREPQERFFRFIYSGFLPGEWIELRLFDPYGAAQQCWFDSVDGVTKFLQITERRDNLFFGVMPRINKVGNKDNVTLTGNILWADLDRKDGSQFMDLVESPLPTPCAVVGTGNGWHAYWKLHHPLTKATIEVLNGNIAATLNSDHVGDCARIMRVPYTNNVKPGLPTVMSDLMKLDNDCPGHYAESFTITPGETVRKRAVKIKKAMEPGHNSRSEVLFAVACNYVLRGGKDNTELESLMLAVPEGEKLLEMSPTRREQWVNLTLKNARKTILKPRGS